MADQETRGSYQKTMEDQVNQLGQRISELLGKLEVTARTEYAKQREILEPKLKAVQEGVKDLSQSTEEAWNDVKPGLERAWSELRKSFEQAASRFNK